ncbi:hypothetical protein [Modestobacter versicolor]|uniref:Chemotaxis phosphatase CheX-like domain-containing protein n=1 Tax=Modestobacter versicolor TaxID=429133 RepID=A0A323VCQ4_9ACTN|nr:hypothetical protein [Modestobacter versicolor]MBB3677442.1 hypothetical protein [Modestobacter versicolor]PZA21960.1 hypothetical protein DMO24_07610 [Modestobacter versicolor]
MTSVLPALLPTAKDVRDMLEGLFGKDVTVSPGDPVSLNDKPAVAVYVDPTMATTALCLLDIRLAAWFAGALALLPKGGLEDAIDEGELYPMHLEAVYEVVNIAASMFNGEGRNHSKLHALHAPGEAVPGDIAGLAAAFNRIDLVVDVDGYGKGNLSIVMAH